MFIDEVKIYVKAGDGGNGCVAFRREKFVAKGGPSGGDGGRGGDVVIVSSEHYNTLLHLRYNPEHKAERGGHGEGSNRTGADGDDREVKVPVGTVIYDWNTHEQLCDLNAPNQRFIVARGGRGGKGNARYAKPWHQTPTEHEPGFPGPELTLRLELKLLADVGLVGFPNAGKSTLISRISAAKPKIADYPFTTLHPNLGVVRVGPEQSFVVADIPGLIEGASEGAGLGHQFLRHLQRTRLLLHMVDFAPFDDNVDPVAQAKAIVGELKKYDQALFDKPRWLVLNKIDMVDADARVAQVKEFVRRMRYKGPVFEISALTHDGCDALSKAIYKYLHAQHLSTLAPVDVDPRFAGTAADVPSTPM